MSSPWLAGFAGSGLLHHVKNHLATMKVLTKLIEPVTKEEPYSRYFELLKREMGSIEEVLHPDIQGVEREYVSVNSLLQELKELFLCKNQDKEIVVEFFSAKEGYVFCNSGLLREAFYNVWQNAIEAMGGKGTLSIRVWESKHDHQRPFLCVSFSDTGPGVPKELITWFPRPLFTTKKDGLGLGLSIAYAVAIHCGGSMDLQSDQKGTTVTFSLPLSSPTS